MNTYNVSVNGVEILKEISYENLEREMRTLRPLVWLTGGNDKNITITENSLKN